MRFVPNWIYPVLGKGGNPQILAHFKHVAKFGWLAFSEIRVNTLAMTVTVTMGQNAVLALSRLYVEVHKILWECRRYFVVITSFSLVCSSFRFIPKILTESLPNRYSALSLTHVCACVTGLQHSELYRFGRFAILTLIYRRKITRIKQLLAPRFNGKDPQIFTALHVMQTRYSEENSVRPSVCLSVCHTRDPWQNARKIRPDFIPYERTFILVFWGEEWLVGGDPFYLKFWVNRPPLEKNRRFWTDNRS